MLFYRLLKVSILTVLIAISFSLSLNFISYAQTIRQCDLAPILGDHITGTLPITVAIVSLNNHDAGYNFNYNVSSPAQPIPILGQISLYYGNSRIIMDQFDMNGGINTYSNTNTYFVANQLYIFEIISPNPIVSMFTYTVDLCEYTTTQTNTFNNIANMPSYPIPAYGFFSGYFFALGVFIIGLAFLIMPNIFIMFIGSILQ